jgi:hypothetical protein
LLLDFSSWSLASATSFRDPVKVRRWKDEKVPGLLAKLADALAALPGRNYGIPCPFPLFIELH